MNNKWNRCLLNIQYCSSLTTKKLAKNFENAQKNRSKNWGKKRPKQITAKYVDNKLLI